MKAFGGKQKNFLSSVASPINNVGREMQMLDKQCEYLCQLNASSGFGTLTRS